MKMPLFTQQPELRIPWLIPPTLQILPYVSFSFFIKIKETVRGCQFPSHEEAIGLYLHAVNDIPEEAWIEMISK